MVRLSLRGCRSNCFLSTVLRAAFILSTAAGDSGGPAIGALHRHERGRHVA